MSDLSERLRVDAHEAMMGALRREAGVEEEEMADYSGLSAKFEAYAVEVAELEAKYAKAIKVIACSVSDDQLDVAEARIAELELERETLIDSNNDRLRFENRDLRDRIRELELVRAAGVISDATSAGRAVYRKDWDDLRAALSKLTGESDE